MIRPLWELPEESRGVHVNLALIARRDEVAEHLRRVLGYGESVTVLDSQRAVRIVERMGDRTELLYSEAPK